MDLQCLFDGITLVYLKALLKFVRGGTNWYPLQAHMVKGFAVTIILN